MVKVDEWIVFSWPRNESSLSTTRWESHIESVKAIKSQVAQVRNALFTLVEITENPQLSRDINMVSTKLQSEHMRLDVAVKALETLVNFFENYRETGFAFAMRDAKEIALDSKIDPVFQTKHHRPRKRHHDEVDGNEREQQSAKESFRIYYFLVIVDIALSQLKHRFEQLKAFESIFGFLFDASKLISLDDKQLKENCMNLEAHLKHGNTMDVDGADLCSELQTNMTQDRLNGLAILCIEKDQIEDLEYDDIIDDFASKNARRQFLKG
ncbi:unnamed protein product [Malus baccata var. baccata]